jgi:hypothetical protein
MFSFSPKKCAPDDDDDDDDDELLIETCRTLQKKF